MKKRARDRVAKGWGLVKGAWGWVRERRLLALSLALMVAGLVGAVSVSLFLGSWLTGTGPGEETGSTTLRNLGIGLAALAALPLAVWRAQVADQQAEAAREQAEAAERQAETAQEDLRNKRYQESAEMLGSEVLSVRLGGIYALRSLAEEHPAEYHKRVMRSLCAFVRHPTTDQSIDRPGGVCEDVELAAIEIAACHHAQIDTEFACGLDLGGADLRSALLPGVDLSSVDMSNPGMRRVFWDLILPPLQQIDAGELSPDKAEELVVAALIHHWPSSELLGMAQVILIGADLRRAFLRDAKLRSTILAGADLTDTVLIDTDLSGAVFSAAKGLTQEQLDSALCDPKKPPDLGDLVDPGTDKPLRPPFKGLDGKPHPKLDDDADD